MASASVRHELMLIYGRMCVEHRKAVDVSSETRSAGQRVEENPNHATEPAHCETDGTKRVKSTMHPALIALVLVSFALFQVAAYTAFRLADFHGWSFDSLARLLGDKFLWLGVAGSVGVFFLSFTLVRISESSLVLVLFLYLNSILVYFAFLPITWRVVFNEHIFSSTDRVISFSIALVSGIGLLVAMYFWNRGG